MLNKIIAFSIKNKLIIGMFTIALICYGAYETTRLPIDAVPDITNNQVQVITVAPSFGANDIERLVTFPIEQANSNIDGIEEIRSFSRFGLSVVTIVFDDQTDVYWARQQVTERLQNIQSQIPKYIGTPELGPITTGLGEIYQYVVRPKKGYENKYNETELRTIQDWVIRRQLLGIKGVAEVSSFGGKLKQYEVGVDPNKLQSLNVTIHDVFTALENNNQNTGGAYIEKGPAVVFIRSEGLIGCKEDIENIAVKSTEKGIPVFIHNVAQVNIGHATRYGAMCYNDEGEVAGAIVMMLKGANSSEVINRVKKRIDLIQKTLPEGVVIEPFLDRTKMVNNAIKTVETNLMEGALIVVFILVLLLGNFRAGLLVASVIPLAMLFAVIMMNLFGVSGNLMSLGALDFGLIVDGAVIIVEAVMHQLMYNKVTFAAGYVSQEQMDQQVNSAAGKMMNSAVFGQIIILIVYLPIFTLQGIEGKMFKPMAQTVAFALAGAFILSLTYIPMMSSLIISKRIKKQKNLSDRLMHRVEKSYQQLASKVIRKPKMVLSAVFILFIIAIGLLTFLGGEFIPALEEGDFAVETRVLAGSSLKTSIDFSQKAAHILKSQFPEVIKVVTKIGSGEVPTDPMPMDASDMMIILKDKSEWSSAQTFEELAAKMSKALENIPGITTGFQYPVQMRFNELMTGARQDVVCKLFGENLDSLAFFAGKLGLIVNTVEGAQDLYIEPITGVPQVVITYNRSIVAQYNLNIADINKTINTAFAGQSAGIVMEGEKRFDIVVRLNTKQRQSLEDIQHLLIATPQGNQIQLHQLAEVQMKDGPNQIQREDAKRRIVVGFNTRGRDVESIVKEVQDKVNKQLKLPTGYYITYGGAFENLSEAIKRLMIAVPVSLVLIFILLYFAFRSVKQGLLIYSAIPLSAIGGVFFLALRGMPFSISAGIGFIALFGVAVLNGIVLIAEFNNLKKAGIKNLYRIVLTGAKVRLRPILMTALVASLGFLPMALSNGAGAEVQRPLATVVIGGLIVATFLTLFVLPILYIIFENMRKPSFSGKTVLVLFLIYYTTPSKAQKITLEAAIDSALTNNMNLKNERLKTEYQKKLIETYAAIPQTNFMGEVGQINSIYTDTRWGVSQSLNFPAVYSNQKKMLTEEWKAKMLSTILNEAEIRKTVMQLFCHIILLKEKEKLLLKSDSLFSQFLEKARLRFDKGEANIIEKTSAEVQRGMILLQLRNLKDEIQATLLQFQLILNTGILYQPVADKPILSTPLITDTSNLTAHPIIRWYEQQKAITRSDLKLEKSRLLPDINLGYYNMSMKGSGADNVFYTGATRFNSYQLGIGVPLIFGSQKAKINASKTNVLIAEQEYQQQVQQINNELKKILLLYKSRQETVNYIEQNQLPGSKIISDAGLLKFTKGEINYLEWVMINNQAIQIQGNYIDALSLLNESIIEIIFLTTK